MKHQEIKELIKKKENWLYEMSNAITDPKKLLEYLNLKKYPKNFSTVKSKKFFLFRVPYSFAKRMKKNDPKDPLLLQVIIRNQELLNNLKFNEDPVQDKNNIVLPGLIHKYNDRVLWILKTSCAVHCRYCFRKNFPYAQNQGNKKNWIQIINYIHDNKNLNEVIFSGGDPLMAQDHELLWIITLLSKIKHIKRLRIHTRLPVVIPNRITSTLCKIFKDSILKIILVTHINHPQEINEDLKKNLLKLKQSNVILFNQSVLLKNINDSANVLANLSEKLFKNNIIPYYLHTLDKVIGTSHFFVSNKKAKNIMLNLKKMMSGFLVPRLAFDNGSKKSKIIIS
ncbi:EF-P beta-lysylation protein EpmB [Buchnera aphidicola (Melanaphis sacchari)]|uniref:L-lysine 2,3-aminomutase n=1 Tax=Buchnera aphidicola (Melanaphis sacchari) TaxID=2173854 RepID=A0A2U8DGE2_9GAMM|nr:EF-P beta-lysylation protein EpmB [Buchnera aphidicola]AWH90777.1 EF-P beta-lysylation protein EpmB [Buchnera aphidicola (Melanaphis sacchari)]